MKVICEDRVLAESDQTIVIEGNHYFPENSLKREYFEDSDYQTNCPWKGKASYFDIVVDGRRNAAAAWYYPDPKPAAADIRDYVAFWRGVRIET